MPKMKTHRGAAKRFSKTKTGKVKFKHANLRHNLGNQTHKAKKRLVKTGYLKDADAKRIIQVLRGQT